MAEKGGCSRGEEKSYLCSRTDTSERLTFKTQKGNFLFLIIRPRVEVEIVKGEGRNKKWQKREDAVVGEQKGRATSAVEQTQQSA